MPKPFIRLSRNEFLALLRSFRFTRRIDAVHMHHTFIPRQSQFRGLASIEAMDRDHRLNRGFSDIAQHITIAPDGAVWTGRSWNRAPASATGHNGNSHSGPFMFETIGNFDQGEEALTGEQRETVLEVIVQVQKRFGLAPESLRFHNQMSSKSCPGTSIPFSQFLEEVRARHRGLDEEREAERARGEDFPFGSEHVDDSPSPMVAQAMEALAAAGSRGGEEDEGELDENELTPERRSFLSGSDGYTETVGGGGGFGADRGLFGPRKLTAEEKARLRPHVINLRGGQLVKGGEFFSLEGDVRAIFREHLEREAERRKQQGQKLRVLFYAHGGLVGERVGLHRALTHVDWWKQNGIYPIYFIWETGLFHHIGRLLREAILGGGARGAFDATDRVLEKAARRLGGEQIWSGMKGDAERASAPGGGGDLTATLLAEFCTKHPNVELHAVGHSAGAIFHNHFLPAAFAKGVKPFESLHLMAPAVRADEFHRRLRGPIEEDKFGQVTMFTMKTDFELDDHCARIYRKSLLYLIHFALEPEVGDEILGLEESLRRDPELVELFGLEGHPQRRAEVVFSKSLTSSGRSASHSTEHGGFDDDARTMNSVALRVLGLPDNGSITPYPEGKGRALDDDPWATPDLSDLFPSAAASFAPSSSAAGAGMFAPPPLSSSSPAAAPLRPYPAAGTPGAAGDGRGARRALVVGINAYQGKPLSGCVADARLWESTLQSFGFTTRRLLDREATYDRLRAELRQLVQSSRPGDVAVFQFAGHGTQAPDLDGDEEAGPDEAICPVDVHTGALLIDDDLSEILADLPAGVNFTLFMDSCHSGDVSRFGFGPSSRVEEEGAQSRFLPMTPELEQAHAAFRQARGGARAFARGGLRPLRGVLFAACQADELAWEIRGQGAFTAHATRVLREGLEGFTNRAFYQRVLEAFGAVRRQTPALRAEDDLLGRPLLAPLNASTGAAAGRGAAGIADAAGLADEVQRLAERLRAFHG